jgi:hypothetical protein
MDSPQIAASDCSRMFYVELFLNFFPQQTSACHVRLATEVVCPSVIDQKSIWAYIWTCMFVHESFKVGGNSLTVTVERRTSACLAAFRYKLCTKRVVRSSAFRWLALNIYYIYNNIFAKSV